jgi:class 3 adenylate cyclase
MRKPPRILAVDDTPENLEILQMRLESKGYEVLLARDGEEGLAAAKEALPDLILLDIMMPKLDGIEVVKRLKADRSLPFIPIILVTAKADAGDVVAGLEAGGDDYLTKPFEHAALLARVRSMLRIKQLHDDIADMNRSLEARVAAQVAEIERMARLKRFLAPQVAELIVAAGQADTLATRRRDIAVLFCDLRGFTAFAETAEPEEVLALLRDYHAAVVPLIHAHEGTLERFAGDGIMVLFNDPLPCPDPTRRAVALAMAMRDAVDRLKQDWAGRGHSIGFGIGISQGYATIGPIGFADRQEYTAIGTVPNTAARLCAEAVDGQILISQRVASALDESFRLESVGELALRGLSRPTPVHNVVRV